MGISFPSAAGTRFGHLVRGHFEVTRLFRKLDIVLPEALILLRARYSRKLTVQ